MCRGACVQEDIQTQCVRISHLCAHRTHCCMGAFTSCDINTRQKTLTIVSINFPNSNLERRESVVSLLVLPPITPVARDQYLVTAIVKTYLV